MLASPSKHRAVSNQTLITSPERGMNLQICLSLEQETTCICVWSLVFHECQPTLRTKHRFSVFFILVSTWRHVFSAKTFSKSYRKWEMLEITWNAVCLKSPDLPGNCLPITQTGLQSLTRQERGKLFSPSDMAMEAPCGGLSLCGNTVVCVIVSEQQLGSLWAGMGLLLGDLLQFALHLVFRVSAVRLE